MLWFILVLTVYVCCLFLAPFPYWKTYLLLWRCTILHKNKSITRAARFRQAKFLLKYVLLCPFYTFFWYLDELLYPDYNDRGVTPVFIVGQPRSGTTFLHRTLARDNLNFEAVKHIEWRYPFISFQKFIHRYEFTRNFFSRNYWPKSKHGEIASKMHPNSLSDWEEDGIFYEECFLHHFFIFLRFPYPEILSYLDEFPSLPERVRENILRVHNKVVKKVMYLRGSRSKFYLSKEVTSHNKIPFLLQRFPDARFIVCVRKAEDFMSSLLPLVKYSTQAKNGIDPMNITGWEDAINERMSRDCLLLRSMCEETIPSAIQARTTFNVLTKDLFCAISDIYQKFGLEMSAEYEMFLKDLAKQQTKRDKGYLNNALSIEGYEEYNQFVKKIEGESFPESVEGSELEEWSYKN